MARSGTAAADDALVILLASGASIDEAAEASGISRRTIYRRLDDAKFQARIEEARQLFTTRALHRLLSLRLQHVENIHRLSGAERKRGVHLPSEAVQLNASKAIIELGGKLRVEHELEQRIRDIEERLAQQGGSPPAHAPEGGAP